MNTFAVTNPKEFKLTDVDVLSKKDRDPGEAPGIQLSLIGSFDQSVLSMFAEGFASALFEPADNSEAGRQARVEDEYSELTALSDIAKGLDEFGFKAQLTGYSGKVDFGLGGKSNIDFEGAMLYSWKFFPQEGGTVIVKFKVDIPNAGEKVLGKFGIMKSQKIHLTFEPPAVEDGKPDPAQIGLIPDDSASKKRPKNPFTEKAHDAADEGAKDGQAEDGTDTPAKALARAHKAPK